MGTSEITGTRLIVFDDIMAQAMGTSETEAIHRLLGDLGHVNLAEL